MTTPRIAIDPGASGGIAWDDGNDIVAAESMPKGMTEQVDELRTLKCNYPDARVVIEKVGGYMPGNSGPAACTFARHCGNLEAALYCLEFPVEQVAPTVWQSSLGTLPTAPKAPRGSTPEVKAQYRKAQAKAKTERKNAIKEMMQRRYPHLKVTLATADALGILTWAMKEDKP